MSLLESLLGSALRGAGQATGAGASGDGSNPLLQILMQLLAGNGAAGGGLEGLLQQFQQAGLGQQMGSWISTGQNLPISAEQIEQVFGQGRLQDLAGQAGMSREDLGGALAETLPQFIDRATPQGQIPQGGLDEVLASLSGMMPRT